MLYICFPLAGRRCSRPCISYGISDVELPMIGLYPLQPSNSTNPLTPLPQASLSALFSSLSLTQNTVLPNSLLATPTFTTPAYLFNTSVPTASPAMTDLATSTYEPLLVTAGGVINASRIPQRAGVAETITVTDSAGGVHTTTTVPSSSQALGEVPGWSSGATGRKIGVQPGVALLGVLAGAGLVLW